MLVDAPLRVRLHAHHREHGLLARENPGGDARPQHTGKPLRLVIQPEHPVRPLGCLVGHCAIVVESATRLSLAGVENRQPHDGRSFVTDDDVVIGEFAVGRMARLFEIDVQHVGLRVIGRPQVSLRANLTVGIRFK